MWMLRVNIHIIMLMIHLLDLYLWSCWLYIMMLQVPKCCSVVKAFGCLPNWTVTSITWAVLPEVQHKNTYLGQKPWSTTQWDKINSTSRLHGEGAPSLTRLWVADIIAFCQGAAPTCHVNTLCVTAGRIPGFISDINDLIIYMAFTETEKTHKWLINWSHIHLVSMGFLKSLSTPP